MSGELAAYLSPMGWTVDEFAALRTYGVRPPKDIVASDLDDMAQQNAHVPIATELAKNTMKISSPDDFKVDELLNTDEDVEVAVFLSKVLTKALINRTQRILKAKLTGQTYVTPQFSSDMQSQISKIAAAETTLASGSKQKSSSEPPAAGTPTPATAPEKPTEVKKKRTPITAPDPVIAQTILNWYLFILENCSNFQENVLILKDCMLDL